MGAAVKPNPPVGWNRRYTCEPPVLTSLYWLRPVVGSVWFTGVYRMDTARDASCSVLRSSGARYSPSAWYDRRNGKRSNPAGNA